MLKKFVQFDEQKNAIFFKKGIDKIVNLCYNIDIIKERGNHR